MFTDDSTQVVYPVFTDHRRKFTRCLLIIGGSVPGVSDHWEVYPMFTGHRRKFTRCLLMTVLSKFTQCLLIIGGSLPSVYWSYYGVYKVYWS